MNKSITPVIVRLVALLALIVVTFNLWGTCAALDKVLKSRDDSQKAKIGFLEASALFFDLRLYRDTANPRPGAPLALEDFAPNDPHICQEVKNWDGVGCFYLLGHVPPPDQPYAVYTFGGNSVPDVKQHPEWEISARIRDGSLQPQ